MPLDNLGRGGGSSKDFAEVEKMLRNVSKKPPQLDKKLVFGLIIIGALLWLSTGFYIVAPDERGVVLRFGRLVRVTDSGPHLRIPWPIETVTTSKVTEVQRLEVGFRTVGEGQYEDVPGEARMLTGDENIVSLEFIVQYQVKSGDESGYAVGDYLFNLEPRFTKDGKSQTVKEVAEAAMREVVGRQSTDMVLTEGKSQVQTEALKLMQSILDRYQAGIQITAVQLQDVQPPTDEVRNAFKDVASAREDKARSAQEGEAYSNDILPKAKGEAEAIRAQAEGYAKARIAEAQGEANRFLSILAEYRQAKNVTRERLYLETMEEILGPAEKIIVDSKTAGQMLPYLPLRAEKGAIKP